MADIEKGYLAGLRLALDTLRQGGDITGLTSTLEAAEREYVEKVLKPESVWSLSPLFAALGRPCRLTVESDGDQVRVTEFDFLSESATQPEQEPNVEPGEEDPNNEGKQKKAPPKALRIQFGDGYTVADEQYAKDAFIKALMHIGLERIPEEMLYRKSRRYVTLQKPDDDTVKTQYEMFMGKRGAVECPYWISTTSSTEDKQRYLKELAAALQLELSVETVDRA